MTEVPVWLVSWVDWSDWTCSGTEAQFGPVEALMGNFSLWSALLKKPETGQIIKDFKDRDSGSGVIRISL